jgi:hypothetical protein
VSLEEKSGKEYWEVERIGGKQSILVGGTKRARGSSSSSCGKDGQELMQAGKMSERRRRIEEEEKDPARSEDDLEGGDSTLE